MSIKLKLLKEESTAINQLSVIVWESVPEVENVSWPILMKLAPAVGLIEILQNPSWFSSLTFSSKVTGGSHLGPPVSCSFFCLSCFALLFSSFFPPFCSSHATLISLGTPLVLYPRLWYIIIIWIFTQDNPSVHCTAYWIKLRVNFAEGGNRIAQRKPSKSGWDRLKLDPHTTL